MVDLNIPVGVSDFEKLRENNYYYIDKTGFISKLLCLLYTSDAADE